MNALTRAYNCAPLLLILGTLGWAGNTVAGRMAAGEVSPMMLIFLRWGLVTLILGVCAWRQIKPSIPIIRPHFRWTLWMGAFLSAFNGLFYWAANYTSAINLGIFQSTIPAFILLGAYLMFHERISKIQLIGLLAILVGAVFVVSRGELATLAQLMFNWGDILMLIACFFYAGYALGLRNRQAINAVVMMWFIAIAAWIATVPMVLIEFALGHLQFPGTTGWLLLVYIALVPSFLSQVFFMRGVDLIGPSRAGLYANLVPVYAGILGVLLLGELPHYYHFVALFAVFGGIYLFERSKKVKEENKE